jgi:Zn-dependent M16 (insulinase) family peptidase
MTPFPFVFGPSDDWDPQGYANDEEELEDELMKAGMSLKNEDEEEDETKVEEEVAKAEGEKDDEEDEVEAEGFEDATQDPLAALDDLADQINRTERETLRFKGDFDE